MVNAIWTLLKFLVVAAAIIFLMEQDGSFEISWNEYVVTIQLGMALVALLLFILILLLVHKLVIKFFAVPVVWRDYWEERSLTKSHKLMTQSLVSLAAGDHKHAAYQAHRAQKLLPTRYDASAATFLEAQAARLMGQQTRANEKFKALLENKDSAFLGIRGLMQTEIEAGQYEKALQMAYSADRMHPKQPWILKTIYDLEIQTDRWDAAYLTLKNLEKHKAMSKDEVLDDRKAILIVLADTVTGHGDTEMARKYLKHAVSIDAGFIPANTRLIRMALERGQKRKARLLIEKCWKISPHPELVTFWDLLAPENNPSKPTARLSWYEKLIEMNPDAVDGYLALAQVSIDDGLWGEARSYLTKAEQLDNHAGVYACWAELERLSTHNDEAVQAWNKKSRNAKQPKKWVCQMTGISYEAWYAIAEPQGLFNTIRWSYPNKRDNDKLQSLGSKMQNEDVLLSAPTKKNL